MISVPLRRGDKIIALNRIRELWRQDCDWLETISSRESRPSSLKSPIHTLHVEKQQGQIKFGLCYCRGGHRILKTGQVKKICCGWHLHKTAWNRFLHEECFQICFTTQYNVFTKSQDSLVIRQKYTKNMHTDNAQWAVYLKFFFPPLYLRAVRFYWLSAEHSEKLHFVA